jgi:hypothetical protein
VEFPNWCFSPFLSPSKKLIHTPRIINKCTKDAVVQAIVTLLILLLSVGDHLRLELSLWWGMAHCRGVLPRSSRRPTCATTRPPIQQLTTPTYLYLLSLFFCSESRSVPCVRQHHSAICCSSQLHPSNCWITTNRPASSLWLPW